MEQTYSQKFTSQAEESYPSTMVDLREFAKDMAAGAMEGLDVYSKGHGVRQDNAEALKWYEKVAEQGDIKVQSFGPLMAGPPGRLSPAELEKGCCRSISRTAIPAGRLEMVVQF